MNYGESEEENELEREFMKFLEEEIAEHNKSGTAERQRRRGRAYGIECVAIGRREAGTHGYKNKVRPWQICE